MNKVLIPSKINKLTFAINKNTMLNSIKSEEKNSSVRSNMNTKNWNESNNNYAFYIYESEDKIQE